MNIINGWQEFLINFSYEIEACFMIILCVCLFYFVVFRKHVINIYDPFFMSLFASAMGASVCFSMYYMNLYYNMDYFYNFILTELAYIFGLLCIKPLQYKKINEHNMLTWMSNETLIKKYLYYGFSISYILSQMIGVIYLGGAPILLGGDRLNFYKDSGAGILAYINGAMPIVILFLLYQRWFFKKYNLIEKGYDILVLLLIVFFQILTGGKSSVLILVNILFYFYIMFKIRDDYRSLNQSKKLMKASFALAILSVFIITFFVLDSVTLDGILLSLGTRILAYGDVFPTFYSDDILSSLNLKNFFIYIFGTPLGTIRLLDYSEIGQSLGNQYKQLMTGIDTAGGVNTRHNVMGLAYFGFYGSVIFSFFLGIGVNLIRNKLFYYCTKSSFSYILYIELCIFASMFATDFRYAINYLWGFIVINLPIGIVLYAFYFLLRREK